MDRCIERVYGRCERRRGVGGVSLSFREGGVFIFERGGVRNLMVVRCGEFRNMVECVNLGII